MSSFISLQVYWQSFLATLERTVCRILVYQLNRFVCHSNYRYEQLASAPSEKIGMSSIPKEKTALARTCIGMKTSSTSQLVQAQNSFAMGKRLGWRSGLLEGNGSGCVQHSFVNIPLRTGALGTREARARHVGQTFSLSSYQYQGRLVSRFVTACPSVAREQELSMQKPSVGCTCICGQFHPSRCLLLFG